MKKMLYIILLSLLPLFADSAKDNKSAEEPYKKWYESQIKGLKDYLRGRYGLLKHHPRYPNTFSPVKQEICLKAGYKIPNQRFSYAVNFKEYYLVWEISSAEILCRAKVISIEKKPVKMKSGKNPDLYTSFRNYETLITLEVLETYWGKNILPKRLNSNNRLLVRYFNEVQEEGVITMYDFEEETPEFNLNPKVNDEVILPLEGWHEEADPPFYCRRGFNIIHFDKEVTQKKYLRYYSRCELEWDLAEKIIRDVKRIGNELRKREGLKPLK